MTHLVNWESTNISLMHSTILRSEIRLTYLSSEFFMKHCSKYMNENDETCRLRLDSMLEINFSGDLQKSSALIKNGSKKEVTKAMLKIIASSSLTINLWLDAISKKIHSMRWVRSGFHIQFSNMLIMPILISKIETDKWKKRLNCFLGENVLDFEFSVQHFRIFFTSTFYPFLSALNFITFAFFMLAI